MNSKTKKIVVSAMLAALCCAATMIIKLPSPLGGYINLGDSIVLLCAMLLPPVYGCLAAGIGSALADILSGYAVYAPATFVIKCAMAIAAYFVIKLIKSKAEKRDLAAKIIGGIAAELVMIAGYYIFEGWLLYGFAASLVNILPNAVQGAAGILCAVLLSQLFKRFKLFGSC